MKNLRLTFVHEKMPRSMPLVKAILVILFITGPILASEVDQALLKDLKTESSHNLNRLKSLKVERKNSEVYNDERERSLGQYLQEQERFDLQRERGLAEYRKQKKILSPADDGPEYQLDQKARKRDDEKAEQSRQLQVRTKKQVLSENPGIISQLEDEEFELNNRRPRYDLRKRGSNKWAKGRSSGSNRTGGSSPSFPSSSSGDGGFWVPPPPPIDYTPMPQPVEIYDDIPPPPPPIPQNYPGYDGSGGSVPFDGYDSPLQVPQNQFPGGGDFDY